MNDAATPPRRSIVRRWGPRALFESLLIIFSISLALAINAWIKDLQTAARVREARAYFIEELQGNRAMLLSNSILAHHRRLHAPAEVPMEQPISPDDARPTLAVVFATRIHTSALRDVAWSTFSNCDLLAHMQPEQVFALNDAYEAQARIEQLDAVFYPVLAQLPSEFTSAEDARGPLMSLRLHLAGVIVAEEHAVERLDQALAA